MSISQTVTASNDRPTDVRNREVVFPAHDVQNGNLSTPINDSKLIKTYINNLAAYRQGLSPLRRGIEAGLLHGYILFGPFAKLNPLRDTDIANLVGLLATFGMIIISAAAILLYASSNPPKPTKTITTPNPPDAFNSKMGWSQYGGGFFIGGAVGAVIAYLLVNLSAFGA